nr:unnamed protein product [Spirometra erinaceieuropaei]
MALWRNKFEYLAEVLAFRNRSREHPEYRLKFVWDRVIEWTPASRIRKATQAEISYVLKFVRRYGDPHSSHRSPVPVAKQDCKEPVQEEEASQARQVRPKNTSDEASSAVKPPPQASTTQSLGAKQANKSETKRKSAPPSARPPDSKVAPLTTSGGGAGAGVKLVVARDAISMESTVAHGDMLYDKSIAQFHEACRKRRELKRRAIDSDAPTTNTTSEQEGQTSSADNTRPPPAKKSNFLVQDIKSECFSPGQNGDVQVAATTAAVAPDLSPSPTVKSSPSTTTAGDDVKPTYTSRKISPSPVASPPATATKEGADEASPVAFQCPHCPRRLRRYSLLTAHICNYHRDDVTSNGAGGGVSSNNGSAPPTSPVSASVTAVTEGAQQAAPTPRSAGKREAARSSQAQSRLPNTAASVGAAETVGTNPNGAKKQEMPTQEGDKVATTEEKTPLLVFCPACKFSGPSKEDRENLLRCLICRVWCHRRCLFSPGQRQQLDNCRNPEFDNWICESCATVPPHMPSSFRLRELSRGWRSGCLPRDGSAVEGSNAKRLHRQNLFSEALSLVNWLHQLQPMLVRGRQAVRRLRSSVSTSANQTAATGSANETKADAAENNGSRARSHLPISQNTHQEQRLNGSSRHEDPSAEAGLNFAIGMDLSETDLPFIGGAASDDGISALLMNLPDMNLDALIQEDGETDAALLAKKSLDFCEEERPSPASAYLTLPRRSSVEDPLALSVSSDISRLIDNLGPDYLLSGLPYPGDLVGCQEEMDDLWKRPLPSSSFLCCTSSAGTSAAGTPADTPALLAGTAAGNCVSPFDTPTKAIYADSAAAAAATDEMSLFAPVVTTVTQEMRTMDKSVEEEKAQVESPFSEKPRGDMHAGGDAEAQLDLLSAVSAPRATTGVVNPGDPALPLDISVPADPSWLEAQTQSAVSSLLPPKGEPSQGEPDSLTAVTSSSSAALSSPLPYSTKLDKDFSPPLSQRKPQFPQLAEPVTDLAEVVPPESSGLPYYASTLPISCSALESENSSIKPAANKLEASPSSSSLTPIKFESLGCTPEKLPPFSWVSECHQGQQHPTGRSADFPASHKPSPMKSTAPPLTDLENLEVNVVGPLEQMLDAIEQHLNLLESELRRLEEQEKVEAKRRHAGERVFQPATAAAQDDFFADGGGDSSCCFSSASSCSSLSSSVTSPSRGAALVGATSVSSSTSSSSCSSPSRPATVALDRSSFSASAVDPRLMPIGTFKQQPTMTAVRGSNFSLLRRSSLTAGVLDRRVENRRPFSSTRRHSAVTAPSSRSFQPTGSAFGRPRVRPTSNDQQQQGRLRQMYADARRPPGWQLLLLRTGLQAQVNRRQQKRLATSNYKWSDATELASATTVLPVVAGQKRSHPEHLGRTSGVAAATPKNLEVRVHRFPNDYSTVVNYWYTTLEWLDKNAYEAQKSAQYVDPEEVAGALDEFSTALEADLELLRQATPMNAADGDEDNSEPCAEAGSLES